MTDNSSATPKIVYTKTDEAPALATRSFLPIVERFIGTAGINIETRDISLAGRILSQFPKVLGDKSQADDLAYLGQWVKQADANIIKLPNISASIPQLIQAIEELQSKGFNVPNWHPSPQTDLEKQTNEIYKKVLGSAVNPVLREGNSDRRVAKAVKTFAKNNPHRMGAWQSDSKTHVASMTEGDFFANEQSWVSPIADELNIEFVDTNGHRKALRAPLAVQKDEIIDASMMSKKALCAFYAREIDNAKSEGVLLSLHLKATMMKVSDPIIFGHAVTAFYDKIFEKYAEPFAQVNVNPNNGIGDVYRKITDLDESTQAAIKADIESLYQTRPALSMVDSDNGITNLHVPSDVIIDASMPAIIRNSGHAWGPDGNPDDTKALIPDRSYADVYNETINFCKQHGAFDVTTMGNVSNVGLMAQKAQEYGSHDKTFEIASKGQVEVTNQAGEIIFRFDVEAGDIWRMCQTKDLPIRDWVKLAVSRARSTGQPAVFWLNEARAHDANLIAKVNRYLTEHDTNSLELPIMAPKDATRFTLERLKKGQDTISVTGNIYRDYLTDLFPILELGTSAKMLSIVPLLAGGGLYETGAGGSAPKHVQQLEQENHLRWDSLGEFLALAVCLESLAEKTGDTVIATLANTLDQANDRYLAENKSPSRKCGELDNRGSHFYLAKYWAEALAQSDHEKLQQSFDKVARALQENEAKIVDELNAVQGEAADIGGYYLPDDEKANAVMRPSATFNQILATL